MRRGKLITIEGLDGAGKTTLAGRLRDALAQRGIAVTLLREPGGVRAAERIRALVKDPEAVIGDRAEALLYAAARAQLVEEAILPRLRSGQTVLLDRFVDSSLAYQGVGRGLGIEPVRTINAFATGGLAADRTLLLELDPGLGRRRSHRRGEAPDRLERQPETFFDRIAAGYRELADAEPDRFRRLDAGLAPGEVLEQALAAVEDLF
jgi:dTMP kinase